MLCPLKVIWQNECHKPSDSTSSSFLQEHLASALRRGNQDYKTSLALSPDSREELIWWDTQMIKWNGRTVLTTEPDLTIESDSSTQSLGSLSPEHQNRGTLVSSEELAYKLPGTASGDSSIDNICQTQQEYQC